MSEMPTPHEAHGNALSVVTFTPSCIGRLESKLIENLRLRNSSGDLQPKHRQPVHNRNCDSDPSQHQTY